MSTNTRHGYLVIADISGYTSCVAKTELEHSQEIIANLLNNALKQNGCLRLSARAYHCVLKLARTIADPAGSEENQSTLLAEISQYRPNLLDSTMW